MAKTKAKEKELSGLTGDDREVLEKKNLTVEDIKGAVVDDPMGEAGHPGENLIGSTGIIVFSVLLLASGIFTIVFTSMTVIGIIVGALMILAAVVIPFMSLKGR